MSEELHITSAVVHCAPRRLEAVATAIGSLQAAQVHASAPSGKLIVTLEAATSDEMTHQMASIQHMDGVLSVALVYQCADSLAAMNEELDDAPT